RPTIAYEPQHDYGDDVWKRVEAVGTDRVAHVITIVPKAERNAATDEATKAIVEELSAEFEGREKEIKSAVRSLTKKLVRKRIVEDGLRIDGRGPADIRPLHAEVGLIPTAHGSGLFQRGETQVTYVTTLAVQRLAMMLATIGIDIGLLCAKGRYTTLTDILGAEDAFGDMDFKVAGTAEFVTALQLDTKIDGLPAEVLAQALKQARDARLKILEVMRAAIAEPRPEVRDTAPKIVSVE